MEPNIRCFRCHERITCEDDLTVAAILLLIPVAYHDSCAWDARFGAWGAVIAWSVTSRLATVGAILLPAFLLFGLLCIVAQRPGIVKEGR